MPRSGSNPDNQRISKRQNVPLATASVPASLTLALDAGPEVSSGVVWDISDGGVCLLVRGVHRHKPGLRGELQIRDPYTLQKELHWVEIRWARVDSSATFIGLAFDDEAVIQASFLKDYLRVSWVDDFEPPLRYDF